MTTEAEKSGVYRVRPRGDESKGIARVTIEYRSGRVTQCSRPLLDGDYEVLYLDQVVVGTFAVVGGVPRNAKSNEEVRSTSSYPPRLIQGGKGQGPALQVVGRPRPSLRVVEDDEEGQGVFEELALSTRSPFDTLLRSPNHEAELGNESAHAPS